MLENGVMLQAFEWYLPNNGEYYKNLKSKIEDLKKKGFNAIWLPPVYKATGTDDVGYGIYDLFDLGEFDQKGAVRTKYGTLPELQALTEELHQQEMEVFVDVVLNHKAGADFTEEFEVVQVDEEDRLQEISEPHLIEGWTGFNFPGREDNYSTFSWSSSHFSGIDYDQKEERTGIFKILGENKRWSEKVSHEKGNYDYLMFADIDHNHPEVQAELFYWGEWIVDKLNIDGMRFDALKHIDGDFMEAFLKHLEEKSDKELYFFGEYWMYDAEEKNQYLDKIKYNTDLFDVALHYNMEQAAKDSANYDLRKIFDQTLVQEHPTIAVTFVDNHDSQPGQALESFVAPWFKKIAYGLILLRKDGYPCVFYGDYYGVEGEHSVTGQKEIIDQLIAIRKRYAYGEQTDYMEDKDLIGWIRHGDEDHPGTLAVVISTGDANTLRMQVGDVHAGKIFVELTGDNAHEIKIDEEGYANFEVGPGTLTCWAEKLAD